jgi:hypothetical protein
VISGARHIGPDTASTVASAVIVSGAHPLRAFPSKTRFTLPITCLSASSRIGFTSLERVHTGRVEAARPHVAHEYRAQCNAEGYTQVRVPNGLLHGVWISVGLCHGSEPFVFTRTLLVTTLL